MLVNVKLYMYYEVQNKKKPHITAVAACIHVQGQIRKVSVPPRKIYERAHVISVQFTFAQTAPLNTLTGAPSGAGGHMFGTSLHQNPFFVFC